MIAAVFAPVTSAEANNASLPFDLPGNGTLKASPKKVFAHYFTAFPISLDDRPAAEDYYTRNYLNPAGENGIHQAYGGLLRDRPIPRAPIGTGYRRADMVTEVTRATRAGLDGFITDLLSIDRDSRHWKAVQALMAAAPSVDEQFKIALMPDMNASTIKNTDEAGLAKAVAELAASPAAFRLDDGRLLVAPFKAENRHPAWWSRFMTIMKDAHGERVAFLPMFLNVNDVIYDGKRNMEAYAPISYGVTETELGSPTLQDGIPAKAARAHDLGLTFMATLSPQDSRPNQGNYYEAGNTENLRAGWTKSITGGADWIQLMTWNDYSESTQVSPSVRNNGVWLDLSSYYLTRFKTGSYPRIVRDAVYVSHRRQFHGDRPTSGSQTKFQSLRSVSMAARDTVEALTFLTAPGSARLTVGGNELPYEAPAGLGAKLMPLRYGSASASVSRNGTEVAKVASPVEVKKEFTVEDLQYHLIGSLR